MRPVAALILAAGASSRFGQPKQLLRLDGESLVRRAAIAAIEGGCAPVAVVVGNLRAQIEAELLGTSAVIVENHEWSRGLGTSIRSGLESLRNGSPDVAAVVLLACDQPLVNSSIIRALIDEQRNSGQPIVASQYAKTIGIPALFDRSCFDALIALPDDLGAKPIIESRAAEVATIAFEGGAIDIDTPADLRFLQL